MTLSQSPFVSSDSGGRPPIAPSCSFSAFFSAAPRRASSDIPTRPSVSASIKITNPPRRASLDHSQSLPPRFHNLPDILSPGKNRSLTCFFLLLFFSAFFAFACPAIRSAHHAPLWIRLLHPNRLSPSPSLSFRHSQSRRECVAQRVPPGQQQGRNGPSGRQQV